VKGREGEKGARDTVTTRRRGKKGMEGEGAQRSLAREGGLFVGYLCIGALLSSVTPLLLGRSICLLRRNRFEEPQPVRTCSQLLEDLKSVS